jgi:hypothetical protein
MFGIPFGFHLYSKVYPEKDFLSKKPIVIHYGFIFLERKRRVRILKMKESRSRSGELVNPGFI